MVSICVINGSLNGKKSTSLRFIKDLDHRLLQKQYKTTRVSVRAKVSGSYPVEDLLKIANAKAIVFVFPLHNYGLPGALMRLLEDYYQFIRNGSGYNLGAKVYAIVNCGYPKSEKTTGEAVRVIKNFCRRLSLSWRFAICIGTGPVVAMTKRIPFSYRPLKKAYAQITSDLQGEDNLEKQDYFIKPIIPEAIIAFIKRQYEKRGKMYE